MELTTIPEKKWDYNKGDLELKNIPGNNKNYVFL